MGKPLTQFTRAELIAEVRRLRIQIKALKNPSPDIMAQNDALLAILSDMETGILTDNGLLDIAKQLEDAKKQIKKLQSQNEKQESVIYSQKDKLSDLTAAVDRLTQREAYLLDQLKQKDREKAKLRASLFMTQHDQRKPELPTAAPQTMSNIPAGVGAFYKENYYKVLEHNRTLHKKLAERPTQEQHQQLKQENTELRQELAVAQTRITELTQQAQQTKSEQHTTESDSVPVSVAEQLLQEIQTLRQQNHDLQDQHHNLLVWLVAIKSGKTATAQNIATQMINTLLQNKR